MQGDHCDPHRASHPRGFPDHEAEESGPAQGQRCLSFPVSAVLPAGGSGERAGLRTPKQFCCILDRPLISHTVQAFERVSWIQSVVVVVAKENVSLMSDIVRRFQHRKVIVVTGGSTRHRSIRNGVLALAGDGGEESPAAVRPKVVIIHDAVRPFVEEDFLYEITTAAEQSGASGAIRPLVSTVIGTTADGFLDHSLEREKYRASEMPQGFTYDVIYQAYQQCSEWDLDFGTECLHLALRYCGTNAKLLPGPASLWKVTYKRDLAAAESIIKDSLSRSVCVITGGSALEASLAGSLQKAAPALHTDLLVVPDVSGGNSSVLSQHFNFINISVAPSHLSEVKSLLKDLNSGGQSLLQPLVLIQVFVDESSVHKETVEKDAVMDLASRAKERNILVYGVQIHLSQDSSCREQSVVKLAEISLALIGGRSPALVGQLLQV